MAIKEKKDRDDLPSRLIQALEADSKVLNIIILLLSVALIILGVFLLNGTLEVKSTVPVIGSFPTAFAIIILVIGAVSLVYGMFPFAKAAFPELKRVTWPNKNLFLMNILKVFSFLIIFTLVYLMYDVLVSELISGILKIK